MGLVMGLCTLDGDLSSAQHGAMYRHMLQDAILQCETPTKFTPRLVGPKRRGRAHESSVEVEVRRYGRPVDVSVSNPKTTPPLRRNVDRRNDPQNPTDLGRISDETA
jgi:hypothetical protein